MIKVRIDGKDKWLNDAEFAEYRAKQEKKNLARRAAEKAKRLAAKAKEDKHKAKLQLTYRTWDNVAGVPGSDLDEIIAQTQFVF